MSPYLAICAVYRDEAPYLREWIEFHRLVGVERFYLYNNLSVDGHREVLAPYVEAGIVAVTDWAVRPAQIQCYDQCLKDYRDEARWIAFIDLDEFLFLPTGQPVAEILTEYEQWPGVGANWAVFGSSGHRTTPAGSDGRLHAPDRRRRHQPPHKEHRRPAAREGVLHASLLHVLRPGRP